MTTHGFSFDPDCGPCERCLETEPRHGEPPTLIPGESMALTVALAQVRRGESPDPHLATVCVIALARIAGRLEEATDD